MRRDPTRFPGRFAAKQKELAKDAEAEWQAAQRMEEIVGIADEQECRICGLASHDSKDCPRRVENKHEPVQAVLNRERKASALACMLSAKSIHSTTVVTMDQSHWTAAIALVNKWRPPGTPEFHMPSEKTKALVAEKLRAIEAANA